MASVGPIARARAKEARSVTISKQAVMDQTLKGEKKAGRELRMEIFNAKRNCLLFFFQNLAASLGNFFPSKEGPPSICFWGRNKDHVDGLIGSTS
jgi:hypothetical protein